MLCVIGRRRDGVITGRTGWALEDGYHAGFLCQPEGMLSSASPNDHGAADVVALFILLNVYAVGRQLAVIVGVAGDQNILMKEKIVPSLSRTRWPLMRHGVA